MKLTPHQGWVEEESVKVALSREHTLCRSKWIVGVNQIVDSLTVHTTIFSSWIIPDLNYLLYVFSTSISFFPAVIHKYIYIYILWYHDCQVTVFGSAFYVSHFGVCRHYVYWQFVTMEECQGVHYSLLFRMLLVLAKRRQWINWGQTSIGQVCDYKVECVLIDSCVITKWSVSLCTGVWLQSWVCPCGQVCDYKV